MVNNTNKTTRWKALVLFFLLWILLSIVSYNLVVVTREKRFDFYPRWVGAREVLQRNSPYSSNVTLSIQEGMFGRHLQPHEDQQQFAYTPLITWLLFPFWIIPFPLAISLWCGLQFALLLVAPLLIISILRWRITLISFLTLLVFSTIIYRYPINAYLLGQFIPFILVCVIIALWGLVQGHEILSGIALIWAMVRPEVTIILVL